MSRPPFIMALCLGFQLYGRAWQSARTLALGPELAASGPARRPYDLRHAALLWPNAGGYPVQIAAPAGHSVAVLLTVYSHCIHGQDDLLNQQIDHVLEPLSRSGPCPSVRKPAVTPDRATGADAVRYTSVTPPPGPPTARKPRQHQTGTTISTADI
jgi:hypothetical protein